MATANPLDAGTGHGIPPSQTFQQRLKSVSIKESDFPVKKVFTRHPKEVECFRKSKYFTALKSKHVKVLMNGDQVVVAGPDEKSIKPIKQKVEEQFSKIKSKKVGVNSSIASLLTMEDVMSFIDLKLDIPNKSVAWGIEIMLAEEYLIVFALNERDADENLKQVMRCITEIRFSLEEIQSENIQNIIKRNSSRLISTQNRKEIVIYTTQDIHDQFFSQNAGKISAKEAKLQAQSPNQQISITSTKQMSGSGGTGNDTLYMVGSPTGETTEKVTERKSAQVIKTSGIQLPSHWCDMGNEHFMKIAIKPGDDSFQNHEWENIQTKFESTLPQARIVSIQRIQNIFMWKHFFLKKRQLEHAYGKDCSNKLPLFHGTTPDMLDDIAEPRLAEDRMGARLGQGTYFTVSPEYSDLYAESDSQGHKFMIFADVLAGKSCIGKADFKRPPLNPDIKPRLYDSCVDNVQKPKVYCIFYDTQYYLKYLIEYT
ncbi:poly [ADP-ribose] polymerase 7/11/12/13 [Mytilus galloprovincialis]|uniref:Poly [ADP-ribose] polymerase n=1 Tax=Mytilus galloprovincialis TaxID=29158 RepID=A0A8B6CJ15_MYTGA|nr:poly [ADP-ribose] polymerase 7/11/12/13 [Mytilus galloprovincialis]